MKPSIFLSFALIALIFTSCLKNDNPATGTGDALIIAKHSGTNTVYGITLYAYSFGTFKSVTAINSNEIEKTYTLVSNQGYKTNFYYETPNAEFTSTKPTGSAFNFSAVFENGATTEFQDILTDKVLAVPTIGVCAYNPTKQILEISWTLLPDANSYAINILDGPTLIFASTELANTIKSYEISATSIGWATGFTPLNGKSYTVKLFAFLYEPGGGVYDMQAASVAEKTVAWGN
ncbi:MAG: hypothetical protein Q8N05_21350 [Bacteroidota bacterium]|nr:hypothetical protein [Bacteroidota bacterium]